jgi:hypothetical protein
MIAHKDGVLFGVDENVLELDSGMFAQPVL